LCKEHISAGSVIEWESSAISYTNYCILKHGEDYKSVDIGWGGLLYNYSQLLFIKQMDMDINTECVVEGLKNNSAEWNERKVENALIISYFPIFWDDFYAWFVEFIMKCNYKCTNCGEKYEDGLPSLEMVSLHVRECFLESDQ